MTEKIQRTQKEDTSSDIRFIYLYASHPALVSKLLSRLIQFSNPNSTKIKRELGLSLLDHFVIIPPGIPAKTQRELIKKLEDSKELTILIGGRSSDRNHKILKEDYKKAELIWVHPSERQFHIDLMGIPDRPTHKEAVQKMHKDLKMLEEYFTRSNILTL